MALALLIQEFGPEKTRAAWTVVSLGAGVAMLVATPLFVMFLFRRARLREKHVERRANPSESVPPVDPWVESGRRMMDWLDPAQEHDDDSHDDNRDDDQDGRDGAEDSENDGDGGRL